MGIPIAFAGPLRHGGAPIISGVRVILVLFLYVDQFGYGDFLNHSTSTRKNGEGDLGEAPMQLAEKNFVVYGETTQLAAALR